MLRSAFVATLVVGAVCATPVHSQAPPTPPDQYALTNVRIVPAPGRVIERGTVLVRDGRIVAVGAQVNVPAGAIRLDLAGHTVYPGLIDAATSFGLPPVTGQDAEAGSELMPARSAADVWAPAATDLDAVRNAGVTTLGLAFGGGIFPGRIAAVMTGGAAPSKVLRSPIAQQIALGRRRGGYPTTLMGAIAYVRQSFYDVQYDMRARQAWERNPSGPRPAYDVEHRALQTAVSGELPVWFVASGERELNRVGTLASDIGVRNYVVLGGQEGWRSLDAVKRNGQPFVVSLDWPSANEVSGRSFELNVAPVAGRNTARAEADSAVLRDARSNAVALARAGVTFALASYGLPNSTTLRDRVRTTVEAGLSADDALRALTVTPARLLGLENAIGTIEPGKLANLVVTRGDLFAKDTKIRHVFVEGVRYDVPEPPAEPQRNRAPGAAAPGAESVAGIFVGTVDAMGTTLELTLTIAGSGDALTGKLESNMGTSELRGRQNGNEITLSGTAQPPGMDPHNISITARVTGDVLRGTLTPDGLSAIEFNARRRPGGASHEEGTR